jgi:hypothetical protein
MKGAPPNQPLDPTGAAFRFWAGLRHASGPGGSA